MKKSKYYNHTRQEVLELSEQEFHICMVNMLKTLMDKVDDMQEEIGNVNREMKVIGKKRN